MDTYVEKKINSHDNYELLMVLSEYKKAVAYCLKYPARTPGRIEIMDWVIEFVDCGAVTNFIDQLLIRRMNDFIPDNETPLIIDCGANIGVGVLNYKKKFPRARIIAFEPDPVFLPVLINNLNNNGASDVRVIQAAAWIENREHAWYSEGIDASQLDFGGDNKSDIVKAVDLKEYLKNEVDLLKLDIEGSEYEVVSHLGDSLHNVKNIIVECHLNQSKITSLSKLLNTLSEYGFKLSINTFGAWRDLIRQSDVQPFHWEQYVLLAGWRKTPLIKDSESAATPYLGAELTALINDCNAYREGIKLTRNELKERNHIIKSLIRGDASHKVLNGPYKHESGLSWIVDSKILSGIDDDDHNPERSRLILMENDAVLGPAHCLHDDIRLRGSGRFSHWKGVLYFSTSDKSNPNNNGKIYSIIVDESNDD